MTNRKSIRIRILSDLHREFGHRELPPAKADVVVLAGDTDRAARGVQWAKQTFRDVPVLYIAGNHEHYGERMGRLHEKLRAAAEGSNVRVLENESFSFGDWHFFGATLWTDFCLLGDRISAMAAANDRSGGMNDFRQIRRRDIGRLRPGDLAMLHQETRQKMEAFLHAHPRQRSIVITHHAPSHRSIPSKHEADLISAAYASALDPWLEAAGPALWVHGHIHEARNYRIGATRVVCNPLGYESNDPVPSSGFRDDLVVNLSDPAN